MKVIIVDDEPWMLKRFEMESAEIPSLELTGSFRTARGAIEFVRLNPTDIAFLDIEMPVMGGFELAKELRKICPEISIVFLSAYDEYRDRDTEAVFMTKPYDRNDIEAVISTGRIAQ